MWRDAACPDALRTNHCSWRDGGEWVEVRAKRSMRGTAMMQGDRDSGDYTRSGSAIGIPEGWKFEGIERAEMRMMMWVKMMMWTFRLRQSAGHG
jgi:hypothetical protein